MKEISTELSVLYDALPVQKEIRERSRFYKKNGVKVASTHLFGIADCPRF
jgi:hypothetical protein